MTDCRRKCVEECVDVQRVAKTLKSTEKLRRVQPPVDHRIAQNAQDLRHRKAGSFLHGLCERRRLWPVQAYELVVVRTCLFLTSFTVSVTGVFAGPLCILSGAALVFFGA